MTKHSRIRPDEWTGHCTSCDAAAVLALRKADGRWTLRQLFTRSWEEAEFLIVCRACGTARPAHLQGEPVSLPEWLATTRGTRSSTQAADQELRKES